MADTVAQVIADAQRSLKDLGQSTALRLLNQVHPEILTLIPEIARTSSTLTLTAGTQEYAVSQNFGQIDQAWFVGTGSTGMMQLGNTSIEYLEKQSTNWRGNPATTWLTATSSIDFYLTSSVVSSNETLTIGFNYPPDAGTASGTLTLYGSVLSTLTTGSTVAALLLSSRIYLEGLLYYAARELRPSLAAAFQQAYNFQIQLNKMYIRTRNEGLKKAQIQNVRSDGTEFPSNAEITENGGNSSQGGQ